MFTSKCVINSAIIFLACCSIAEAREGAIEWRLEHEQLTENDKQAIIKLVKQTGIVDPARISTVYVLPTGGQILNVESRVTVDGPHRSWLEVSVCRKDWKPLHCATRPRRSVKRVGRWQASKSNVSDRQSWRIQDQGWFLDVLTEANVPYGDAERIVLAIRRGQLVNRLPTRIGPLPLNAGMPDIDASEITHISRYRSGAGIYEVRTGAASGLLLRVKILEDAVELQGYSTWIVFHPKPPNTPAEADPTLAFLLETAAILSKVLSGSPAVGGRAAWAA